jgi:hypothetical protein
MLLARVSKIEIGEQTPGRDRGVADNRLLDLAEPTDEPRREPARDAVG